MARPLALVVDRDSNLRARLQDRLQAAGAETLGAVSASEALHLLRSHPVDLLLAAPGDWIVEVQRRLSVPIVVALFENENDLAVTGEGWMDQGVSDLICRELDGCRLALTLKRAVSWAQQRREHESVRQRSREAAGLEGLVGRSAIMERTRERLNRLAPLSSSVWLEGPPGVGKQTCARTLHQLSSRSAHPFVVVDPADLRTPGWEQRWLGASADGVDAQGTLYLNEPAAFDADALARLRRALGDRADGPGALRVVSGSSLSLERVVAEGRLPGPFAQRLAGARLELPALRERPEDVGPLALHFLASVARINQLDTLGLTADALDRLEAYAWPGNARELRNAIEHAVILADGAVDVGDLPEHVRVGVPTALPAPRVGLAARPFREAKGEVVAEFERIYLGELMERECGNVTTASREAGMLRSALQRLLRKYGIKSAEFRRRGKSRTAHAISPKRPGAID